jgi:pyruvate,water dikinase
LRDQEESQIRAELSSTPGGRALIAGMDRFLTQFGFLSACGTDLSRTPWSDDPTVIWRSVGRMAVQPAVCAPSHNDEARRRAQAQVRAKLSPLQRYAFGRLLTSTVHYIDLRERSSFLVSEDSFHLRRIYLALASRLVAQGDMDRDDDVFYLAHEELCDLVHGHLPPREARTRITDRRAQMVLDADLELPDTIYGDYVPAQPVRPAGDATSLTGISGSSGLVEGYARIILDPVQAYAPLSADDILVIPFADTSWTPLFCGVGGVVVETGGQLSHSAIVAREYGLPAVVNVKNATRLIHEGQRIVVDGSHGQVILKKD